MILKLAAALNNPEDRYRASCELAAYFDCKYLFILIRDPEIDVLLTAPGFPETLPGNQEWQAFSAKCIRQGFHSGELPFYDQQTLSASGFSGPDNSVAILLGGVINRQDIHPLQDILPLFIELFKKEQFCLVCETQVKLSEKAVQKADQLVKTIDVMRSHLKVALNNQRKDKQEIQSLMQKKDEFLNVASHELKTPVTSIKAYIQILNKILKPADQSASLFLSKAEKQIVKLTELIEDLLDVSKIQAGQMVYKQEVIEVSEIVEEVITQTQMSTLSHQILFDTQIRAKVYADRNRLEQVLNNLLSNAIKYSPGADKVIIRMEISDQKVHIYIRDFGIGISADKHQFIFDRFFRVQESSQNFPGLGLGLYITSQIILRHQGEIKLKSHQQGSEFIVSLPVYLAGACLS
jgi:signal transduction histidine kinase